MGGIVQVDSVLNNNTSNLITQTNSTTITIGSTGQTISLASGASSSGFGLTWNPTVQTTNFTASVGVGYMVNTTTAAITATLPAAPSIGDQVAFVDFNETAATNNIILNPNGLKIDGVTSNTNIAKGGEGVTILYSGTTRGWIPVSAANEGTQALISQYSLDFLVIGGGGSGGNTAGGGGGAGGYRTSTQTVSQGTVITVTVGDGGASVNNPDTNGNVGSNSSISGSGLTTITSAGGGYGAFYNAVGGNGGSGGGGGGTSPSKAGGTGNTPSTSPSQGNNGGIGDFSTERAGGGGGGAGAVGGNGTTGANPIGGSGGSGTASSITGSSVTRAGGGGGCTNHSVGTSGAGGAGGGGAGAANSTAPNGTAGTANTGGGGGAGAGTGSSGAGGKGVVIISLATIHYSGTSSGSPTVTTSGSNTILQFNGSGTYTV
jgi:hypothetical protein